MISLILHYLGVITIYELLKLNTDNFRKLFCFVFSKFVIEYQKYNIEHNKTHVKCSFDEMTGVYDGLLKEKKMSTVNNDKIPTHLEYMKNIMGEFDGDDALRNKNSLSPISCLETKILKEIGTTHISLEDNIVNKYHNAILNNVKIEYKNVDDISDKINIMQNKRHK